MGKFQGKKSWALAGSVAAITAITLSFQNCAKFQPYAPSANTAANQSANNGGLNSAPGTASAIPKVSLSQPTSQVANLGTQLQIPVTITVDPNYSGTLDLTASETSALKTLDPGAGITLSISPSSMTLNGGGTINATVTVNVTTMAPSFNLSNFEVTAQDHNNPNIAGTVSVPLQVKAIFDIAMRGKAAPENWSIAVGSVTKFIAHSEGLVVRFDNYGPAAIIIHSSGGPIPHESTSAPFPGTTTPGVPPSPDGGTTAGGAYVNTVPAGAQASSIVYSHNFESGAQGRTLTFNVPVTPVSPTPVNDPNATFTFINTKILQPMCVGCHSGPNAASGVDLSSYANVLKSVHMGDHATSALYIVVAPPNPSMPLGGTPLSSVNVQAIADWIDLNAPNN